MSDRPSNLRKFDSVLDHTEWMDVVERGDPLGAIEIISGLQGVGPHTGITAVRLYERAFLRGVAKGKEAR